MADQAVIAVAGAAGDLDFRMARTLVGRGADVPALNLRQRNARSAAAGVAKVNETVRHTAPIG